MIPFYYLVRRSNRFGNVLWVSEHPAGLIELAFRIFALENRCPSTVSQYTNSFVIRQINLSELLRYLRRAAPRFKQSSYSSKLLCLHQRSKVVDQELVDSFGNGRDIERPIGHL